MRIDHHAYQRGTQVAGFGFLLQFVIGFTLLIFGWVDSDSTLQFAATYILLGLIVWISLIVIFHQHKLERLEALEEDELAAARAGTSSIFDAATDESRVAARRLALMYKWLMPIASLVLAGLLVILGLSMLMFMFAVGKPAEEGGRELLLSDHIGWTVAVCLGVALVSFIFSRFVAGMAKLPAWQNLRGGAGYMVGNALVMLAVAAGTAFRVFDNDAVLTGVAFAIPFYMGLVALEIILNFILNLYRPRIPGETPRPAFDSRILSLLAAPDSLVRSLNEAVNYQFGFDITSSWGYQLLLRSFAWLVALGVGVAVLLNTMVVVEPHQQAVKLSWGKLVGEPHGAGIMWKLPWPIQSAEIYNISRIRTLDLTARELAERRQMVYLWHQRLQTDGEFEPFIVASSTSTQVPRSESFQRESTPVETIDDAPLPAPDDAEGDVELIAVPEPAEQVDQQLAAAASQMFALVDAEIALQYRIRDGRDGAGGLLEYLRFAPDTAHRRRGVTTREAALRLLALREVTQYLSRLSLDDVLALRRDRLARDLRDRIQQSFDERETGVEVVSVDLPTLRPSGDAAEKFEELAVGNQARQQQIALARRGVTTQLAFLVSDVAVAMDILDQIEQWNALRDEHGIDAPEVVGLGAEIERAIVRVGGAAASMITDAERDRWVQLMDARAQASRTRGQLAAFQASPELYMERTRMNVMTERLGPVRKYLIGVDPGRFNIELELKELSPLLDFSTSLGDGE